MRYVRPPQGFEGVRAIRKTRRRGFFVVRDPYGRYAKVKRENVKFIPKGWRVYDNIRLKRFYIGYSGLLIEGVHCLLEITSRKHAQWFEGPHNIGLGLIFGRFTDAKRKENIFTRPDAL